MSALPGLFVPSVRDPEWPLKPFSLYVFRRIAAINGLFEDPRS
jgi:hypothetical protein